MVAPVFVPSIVLLSPVFLHCFCSKQYLAIICDTKLKLVQRSCSDNFMWPLPLYRSKKPTRDQSFQDLTQLDSAPVFLENLPRLSSTDDDVSLQNSTERSNDNRQSRSTDKCLRLDCMDLVWSMAFGSGISKTNHNIWTRFHFKRDLILATGLQGGTIKLWDVHKG